MAKLCRSRDTPWEYAILSAMSLSAPSDGRVPVFKKYIYEQACSPRRFGLRPEQVAKKATWTVAQ